MNNFLDYIDYDYQFRGVFLFQLEFYPPYSKGILNVEKLLVFHSFPCVRERKVVLISIQWVTCLKMEQLMRGFKAISREEEFVDSLLYPKWFNA